MTLKEINRKIEEARCKYIENTGKNPVNLFISDNLFYSMLMQLENLHMMYDFSPTSNNIYRGLKVYRVIEDNVIEVN